MLSIAEYYDVINLSVQMECKTHEHTPIDKFRGEIGGIIIDDTVTLRHFDMIAQKYNRARITTQNNTLIIPLGCMLAGVTNSLTIRYNKEHFCNPRLVQISNDTIVNKRRVYLARHNDFPYSSIVNVFGVTATEIKLISQETKYDLYATEEVYAPYVIKLPFICLSDEYKEDIPSEEVFSCRGYFEHVMTNRKYIDILTSEIEIQRDSGLTLVVIQDDRSICDVRITFPLIDFYALITKYRQFANLPHVPITITDEKVRFPLQLFFIENYVPHMNTSLLIYGSCNPGCTFYLHHNFNIQKEPMLALRSIITCVKSSCSTLLGPPVICLDIPLMFKKINHKVTYFTTLIPMEILNTIKYYDENGELLSYELTSTPSGFAITDNVKYILGSIRFKDYLIQQNS